MRKDFIPDFKVNWRISFAFTFNDMSVKYVILINGPQRFDKKITVN